MKILFVHQNFPGQFKHLAPALAADSRNQVIAFCMRPDAPEQWQNIRLIHYRGNKSTSPTVHRWVSDLETKVIRGEAALQTALALKAQGFSPDVIIAHPGWGESLFLKDVWPNARIGIYCEFFYGMVGRDVGFDQELQPATHTDASRLRLKNANHILHFDSASLGISPTEWQASTFPEPFRSKISVVHDGIDTDQLIPKSDASLTFPTSTGPVRLTRQDEVITFVSRNMEPYRGYHIFMRALPELLAKRPNARILVVGNDDVSYGAKPPEGKTWKEIFFDEVKDKINPADLSRFYFVGSLNYLDFIALLQISTVHIYLTYPFVLSWSLIEAMSIGCTIVASNTTPLHEAIFHNQTGRLVPFFDSAQLTNEVCTLLDQPEERKRLGQNARLFAKKRYDLKTVCLPKQLEWVRKLYDATP